MKWVRDLIKKLIHRPRLRKIEREFRRPFSDPIEENVDKLKGNSDGHFLMSSSKSEMNWKKRSSFSLPGLTVIALLGMSVVIVRAVYRHELG
jgi:hypothetical protein